MGPTSEGRVARGEAAALICFVLFVVVGATAAQNPEFVDGDPSTLAATIVSTTAIEKAGAFVAVVKVMNRGTTFAEPPTFDVAPKGGGASERWRRCPGPYVGRFGRGVAPGAAAQFQLFVRGDSERWKGATARVVDACFSKTPLESKAPASASEPTQEKKTHETGTTVDFSILPLKNASSRSVDVLVKLQYERPVKCECYATRRLKPGEETRVSFTDVEVEPPGEAHYEDDQQTTIDLVAPRGSRISGATIVEWIELSPPGVADAAGTFDVSAGMFREAVVQDGRIARLTFRDGRERRLTWKKAGERFVAVRVETSSEDLRAEFAPLGTFLIPTRMTFRGVFGDEKTWGTEDLRFSDLKPR